jgi:hypothetical protein
MRCRICRWPRLAVGILACIVGACATKSVQPETIPAPPPTIAASSPSALETARTAASRTLELTASVSLDFAGLSSKPITGQGIFDFASAKGRALIEQPVGDETAVFLPTVLFDDPPVQDAVGLPRGRTWIMAEPAERVPNPTSISQFVLQMQGKNPIFLLAEVAWGAVFAAPLRSQLIDGSKARGYLVEVDLDQAASSVAGPAASALASTIHFEEQAVQGSSKVPVPQQKIWIWVDPSGRVVRLQSSPPGSGVGTTIMTITSFGERIDLARPPRDKSVDLASLAPGGDYDRD